MSIPKKADLKSAKRRQVTALVPSAGSGKRFGAKKTFFSFHGKPVIVWTLEALDAVPEVTDIILAVKKADIPEARKIIKKAGLAKVKTVIAGGIYRQDSVWNGLKLVSADTDLVLVHDGARPFVEPQSISKLINALLKDPDCDGVVPGLMPRDTIKEVSPDGLIRRTLNRAELMAVQTPQVFRYDILREAYENAMSAGVYATDDSALVEAMGGRVKVMPGWPRNIKITTREDIILAEGFFR